MKDLRFFSMKHKDVSELTGLSSEFQSGMNDVGPFTATDAQE